MRNHYEASSFTRIYLVFGLKNLWSHFIKLPFAIFSIDNTTYHYSSSRPLPDYTTIIFIVLLLYIRLEVHILLVTTFSIFLIPKSTNLDQIHTVLMMTLSKTTVILKHLDYHNLCRVFGCGLRNFFNIHYFVHRNNCLLYSFIWVVYFIKFSTF